MAKDASSASRSAPSRSTTPIPCPRCVQASHFSASRAVGDDRAGRAGGQPCAISIRAAIPRECRMRPAVCGNAGGTFMIARAQSQRTQSNQDIRIERTTIAIGGQHMTTRVALVTGGTGGIGTAICRQLAKQGHKVATNYRDEAKTRAWQATLKREAASISRSCPATCRTRAGAETMVREVERAARTDRHPGQQRRHHARHDVPQDDRRCSGRKSSTPISTPCST